jgi:hypothetical protein
MKEYGQFVDAAERKDAATLKRIICECPEIHSHEGDDGSEFDILRNLFPEFIESAFASGLHPDSGSLRPHQTMLQRAVCENDHKLIALCLANGADIERRNCEGETALGYAAAWASLEVVEALLRAGADVNAIEGTAEAGFSTAYDAACSTDPEHGRAEIRKLLRAHDAKSYSELSCK